MCNDFPSGQSRISLFKDIFRAKSSSLPRNLRVLLTPIDIPYLHGKPNFLSVEEAIREGYSPFPICIGKHKPREKGLAFNR
jgi:hypothetical protein